MTWWPEAAPGMASTEFIDPYIDPDTGLLRNEVGATTREDLEQAEGDLVAYRSLELVARPPSPTGDLAELRADNNLQGMTRDRFLERLAYHYEQLNHIHPFREKNGRTQRVFWNRIARDAGRPLD